MPRFIGFVDGKDDIGSLVEPGADIVTSTDDDEALGSAEALDRLWWMVPCVGEVLIKLSRLPFACV